MNYFFKKLLFYFQSQTAHGLHSPLVFDLYCKVLNPLLKIHFSQNNYIKEFEQYFNIPSRNYYPDIDINHERTLLLVNEDQIHSFKNDLLANSTKFDPCIIIIQYPHKKHEEEWNEIKASTEVIFTIDIFELGIVILEKIAPKQNFKLRKLS